MKKSIFLLLITFVAVQSFAQQTNPSPLHNKQDYFAKCKKQKKTAWILLGSGAAGYLIGSALIEGKKGDNIEAFVLIPGGMASMITSVGFFISSGKNKKMARNATAFFKMEMAPSLNGKSINQQSFPAAGIKFSLK